MALHTCCAATATKTPGRSLLRAQSRNHNTNLHEEYENLNISNTEQLLHNEADWSSFQKMKEDKDAVTRDH